MTSFTLLLVDDEPKIRTALQRGFKRSLRCHDVTLKVIKASSGNEAADILRQCAEEIDLVISDVSMGNGNGPELYRDTQYLLEEHDIVFWMMSGAHSHLVPEGVRLWEKPFDMRMISAAIMELIER